MMILISAERATLDDETNALRTERLACRLRREGFAFVRGRGSWGGRVEAVFAVNAYLDQHRIPLLGDIAGAFDQDALMLIDKANGARLYWLASNSTEPVGEWREVSEAEALAAGEWTELGGRYWRAG